MGSYVVRPLDDERLERFSSPLETESSTHQSLLFSHSRLLMQHSQGHGVVPLDSTGKAPG